ncbi:MAG TPA: hypothetical protein VI932_01695 [Bacteroidota bacterium]|nr:hypothetical protein [Bacteroidota bacterium]
MKTIAIILTLTFILAPSAAVPGVPTTGRASLSAAPSAGALIRVLTTRGDVAVRHGASEEWVKVAPGDVLKPEDSMRLGPGASSTLEAGGKKLELPAMVIVDIADLRNITRFDLLLKLAMEDVRSVPKPDPKLGNPGVAKTTTTRAGNRNGAAPGPAAPGEVNALRLGGTRVLHDNGFFGTCILRSREIFRVEPALAERTDARLRVADALEKMNLREEAYDAYAALADGNLSAEEKRLVEKKLEELRKQ